MGWLTRSALKMVLPSGGPLKGIDETDLDRFFEELAHDVPPHLRAGLLAGSLLVMLGPPLTLGVPAPAFLLPEKLRGAHIYRLATHPLYLIRQATMLVKMMAGMQWGRDPQVRDELGVAPLGPDPATWRDSF